MSESGVLVERTHVVVNVLAFGDLEALKLNRLCVVDHRREQRVDIGRCARVLVLVE